MRIRRIEHMKQNLTRPIFSWSCLEEGLGACSRAENFPLLLPLASSCTPVTQRGGGDGDTSLLKATLFSLKNKLLPNMVLLFWHFIMKIFLTYESVKQLCGQYPCTHHLLSTTNISLYLLCHVSTSLPISPPLSFLGR